MKVAARTSRRKVIVLALGSLPPRRQRRFETGPLGVRQLMPETRHPNLHPNLQRCHTILDATS